MSQSISIWGANYTGVPYVALPKTGGGEASFFDVSDTTATAADVLAGKVFHSAEGTQTTGTAESPTAMTEAEILAAVQEGWV